MFAAKAPLDSSTANSESVTIAGIDLTFEYLSISKHKMMKKKQNLNQQPLRNEGETLLLVQGTAEVLPYKNSYFDAAVSPYLAKYVDVSRVVDECWRVLKPSGIIVFHDFTYPMNSAMRRLWSAYFLVLRATGLFIDPWRIVFDDLDKVIKESNWVKQTEALYNRGFQKIICRYCTFGTAAIISAEKSR
jgi:ubiquinone/menaquinone biosynthesis C-methylase UbiE